MYKLNQKVGDLVFIEGQLPEAPSAVDICQGLASLGSFFGRRWWREEEGVDNNDLEKKI